MPRFPTKTSLIIFVAVFLILGGFKYAMAMTLKTPGTASYQRGVGLNRGLVGWWTMDGADSTATTVLDKSGQNNTGTSSGGVTKVAGKIGQAMSFDGSSGYLTGPGTNLPDVGNNAYITISAWIKPKDVFGEQEIFNKGLSGGYFNYSMVELGGVLMAGNTNGNYAVSGSGEIKNGIWQHAVVVFNGASGATGYINGVRKLSHASAVTTNCPDTHWVIGTRAYNSLINYFNGLIDDVRVYSRALSASEIKQLYSMGAGAKVAVSNTKTNANGLVGYWTFDGADISGANVYDRSGQNNTGTSSGGVTKVAGKIGQGLRFDGVNGHITATGYETATFTISAWVKTGDATEDKWFVEMTDSSGNRHGIGMYPAGRPVITYGAGKWKNITGSLINDSNWHHFVGTYDGTGAKIYIDSISRGMSAENTTGTKTPSTLTIGSTSSGEYVNSLIDDVRVYSRALSRAEILQLYQTGSEKINKTNLTANRSGLVGHWTFDGNDVTATDALDKSGLGNTGTRTAVTPVAGKLGQAFSFNGTNSTISSSAAIFNSPTTITLSAWVKPSLADLSGYPMIICKGAVNTSYLLFLANGAPAIRTMMDNVATSENSLVANNWHHIVGTYDGANIIKIYTDGVLKNYNAIGGGIYTNTDPLYIGKCSNGNSFAGTIDDARVYSRALSAQEIQQLYAMGK